MKMKKPWTRLMQKYGSPQEKQANLRYLFQRHHANADEIVFLKNGTPLCAIYFTPEAHERKRLVDFMRAIQNKYSADFTISQ